jgi:hypothetical protein
MKKICDIIFISFLIGCSSKPLLEVRDIKITRDEPSRSCRSLGVLDIKSLSIRPDEKKMIDEMRNEARKKGANFVRVQEMGALGTSVRGEAFDCP